MPIYVKYAAIDGDVTAAGHEEWIEVNSFQWGVGRGISSPTGGSADREASAPSVSEIPVPKSFSSSSVSLIREAFIGQSTHVEHDFVNELKGKKLQTYLKVELENTLISG